MTRVRDPDELNRPSEVTFSVDVPLGTPGAKLKTVLADEARAEGCAVDGTCGHGFTAVLPDAFYDGVPHKVFAYALDTWGQTYAPLQGGSAQFTCRPEENPEPGGEDDGYDGEEGGDVGSEGGFLGGCSTAGSHPVGLLPLLLASIALVLRRRRARG